MVVVLEEQKKADRMFRALADATRRDIVKRVMYQDISISDLARTYPMSFAAVQKHVAVLQDAELVIKRPRGREQLVRGNVDSLQQARSLLDQFEALWLDRINRFGEILAEETPQGSRK